MGGSFRAVKATAPCGGRHGSATRCGVVLAVSTAAPLASAILFAAIRLLKTRIYTASVPNHCLYVKAVVPMVS